MSGLAAVCDCGTPWTFLLTFMLSSYVYYLAVTNNTIVYYVIEKYDISLSDNSATAVTIQNDGVSFSPMRNGFENNTKTP